MHSSRLLFIWFDEFASILLLISLASLKSTLLSLYSSVSIWYCLFFRFSLVYIWLLIVQETAREQGERVGVEEDADHDEGEDVVSFI